MSSPCFANSECSWAPVEVQPGETPKEDPPAYDEQPEQAEPTPFPTTLSFHITVPYQVCVDVEFLLRNALKAAGITPTSFTKTTP